MKFIGHPSYHREVLGRYDLKKQMSPLRVTLYALKPPLKAQTSDFQGVKKKK